MEDYKLRMFNEYKELKGKYDRLHRMLVKYDAGKLDFTPTCPIDLLRKQASIMGQYLYVLETRAVIEGVSFNAEDSNDKAESNEAKCDFNYCCCNGAEARIKSETKPGKPKQEPDKQSDDLKHLLFKDAALWSSPSKIEIEDHRTAEIRRSAKQTTLLSLIWEAGLSNEYNEWRNEKGYDF